MHEDGGQFIAVVVKAEEDAYPDVVTAAFLRAVHGLCMPAIIALGAGGMQFFILFLVVSLLEKDIRADAGFLEFPVRIHISCGYVHVYTAYGVTALLHAVNSTDGIQDILQRIVPGILPCLNRKALVAGTDKGPDLCLYFFL